MTSNVSGSESTALFKVPTLTGLEDFFQWKTAMTDSLLMIGALDIVEGTELPPMVIKVEKVKSALKRRWRMTDLGEAKWVLGISMEPTDDGVLLSQSAYLKSLALKFGQHEGRPVFTPLPTDLPTQEGEKFPDQQQYQSLVGGLLWAAVATRADIAFAAGYLGRYSANPTRQHWELGLRVVRYLHTTHDHGLTYARDPSSRILEGWADADYAGDRDTRKSTTGYAFKMFGCLISWGARRQSVVATSTAHAEYIALAESARENAYLRNLIGDLKIAIAGPTPLHGDNEGALTLASKPAFHQRTKHIEVRWHYIREAEEQGLVSLRYVRSAAQLADILTKPLARDAHQRHRTGLGLRPFGSLQKDGEARACVSIVLGSCFENDRVSPLLTIPGPEPAGASASGSNGPEPGATAASEAARDGGQCRPGQGTETEGVPPAGGHGPRNPPHRPRRGDQCRPGSTEPNSPRLGDPSRPGSRPGGRRARDGGPDRPGSGRPGGCGGEVLDGEGGRKENLVSDGSWLETARDRTHRA